MRVDARTRLAMHAANSRPVVNADKTHDTVATVARRTRSPVLDFPCLLADRRELIGLGTCSCSARIYVLQGVLVTYRLQVDP